MAISYPKVESPVWVARPLPCVLEVTSPRFLDAEELESGLFRGWLLTSPLLANSLGGETTEGAYENEGLRRSSWRIRNSDTSAPAAGYRSAPPLRWDLALANR